MNVRSSAATSLALAAALALGACADPVAPNIPASPRAEGTTDPIAGWVNVCKVSGPEKVPFHFQVTVTGGYGYLVPEGWNVDLVVGQCKFVWVAGDPTSPTSKVTVREVDLPAGVSLEKIEVFYWGPTVTGTDQISVDVGYNDQRYLKFYNTDAPPPPPKPEYGCTPGYWKQTQHFGNWTGYAPTNSFNTVFGVNILPGLTLLGALENGGGKAARLGRHATAALLNASYLDGWYGMSAAQVIAAVKSAVAAGPDAMDALASRFANLNERSCPLGRAE